MPDQAPAATSARVVDVAIVGASLAGCATAILLGRAGLRVALIDKHADQAAYKRLCGHFIQASATPMLERLGLVESIEAAGGVRNGVEVWTRWGIVRAPEERSERVYGYNLRRLKLDPMIRATALATPGVDYLPGNRVVALLGDGAAATRGLELRDRKGERTEVHARVVIGADGRNSTVARLARARERRSPNTRFCYATYFSGVERPPPAGGRLWMDDHDLALLAPNDDGLTIVGVFLDNRRLDEFRGDREGALRRYFDGLPGAPPLAGARCEERVQGYTDYGLIVRDPTPSPHVALVGDAALTSDPAMAIGCGWALQSAGWLADSLAPALAGGEPLAPALRRYRRERRRHLMGHHRVIALDARLRRMTPFQRVLIPAAVSDPEVRAGVLAFGERSAPVRRLFTPEMIVRTSRATLATGAVKA